MRWTVRAISRAIPAAAVCAAMCVFAGTPSRVEATAPTPCKATTLQAGPFAHLRGIPWLQATPRSAGITAHLFYAYGVKGKAAMMHTHGRNPGGRTTKVLWLINNPADGTSITINGKNLSGLGKTHQVFPGAGGGTPGYGNFPSIVNVPTSGCWRFQVSSGKARAVVIIPVVG